MKVLKKIFIGLGILLVVLVGALAAIPYFFKDRLTEEVKILINESINAEVDFADVNLSVFRHFPDLTLSLQDLSVVGVDRFKGVPLAEIPSFAITLDLLSLFKDQGVKVENIEVLQPRVKVHVLPDGTANYNIAKATSTNENTSTTSNGNYLLALKSYTIEKASVLYNDQLTNTLLNIEGLNHAGSGAFSSQVFDLDTETSIEKLDVSYQGVDYLNQAIADLKAIFHIDQSSNTYTLKENELRVNELLLKADGDVKLLKSGYGLNLALSAPSNQFKDLLSLIPGAYLEGYEDVKADGSFAFAGTVNGEYNSSTNTLPNYRFDLSIQDGDVQYPGLPLGIKGINAQALIDQSSSNLDDLKVDISDFKLQIGSNPIAGRFKLTSPISDPNVDTRIKGKLDLKELSLAFPLPQIKTLTGVIEADLAAKARMSQLDRGDYEAVEMQGSAQAQNILVNMDAYPNVAVPQASIKLAPSAISFDAPGLQLGKSDLSAKGKITNFLAFFSPDKTMEGDINLKSNYFLADEWVPEASGSDNMAPVSTDSTQTPSQIFDRFRFAVDADVKQIDYADYRIKNSKVKGVISPNELVVQNASTKIDDSDLQGSGTIQNLFDYVFSDGTLEGNLNFRSKHLDLNPFMVYTKDASPQKDSSTTTAPTGYGTLLVPANIDMDLNAQVEELIYTNMNIKNLSGQLNVEDRGVALREVQGKTLGGQVVFNGLYETPENKEPIYGIKLDMNQLNFQEAFKTLNTFRILAPVGAFIDGIFNTTLSLEGTLGEGMMPNLNTINAAGFLETLNGSLKNYPPLQKLGEQLRINELRQAVSLENTKNWLEVKDGSVQVKPFDINIDDIPMTIAGSHSLTQQMDYTISAAIPVEKLDQTGVDVSDGIGKVYQEINKLGLNLKQAEKVDVLINLSGSITKPILKVSFLGLDGQVSIKDAIADKAKSAVEEQKEVLSDTLNKRLESEKARVNKEIDKAVDSAKTKLGQKVDTLLKSKVDTLIAKEGGKLLDSLLNKTEVDKVKKELEKFNPFKKKKKNEGTGNNG